MKRILSAVLFAALPLLLNAQAVTPETFRDNPDKSGGIFYVYHYGESDEDGVVLSSEVKAPAGYKPFYVSHVGRHGSRWHTSPYRYVLCRKVLNDAAQAALREHRGCVSFYEVAKKETLADIDVVLQRIAPDVLGRIFLPGTCPFADDKAKVSVFVRDMPLDAETYRGDIETSCRGSSRLRRSCADAGSGIRRTAVGIRRIISGR